MKNKLFSGIYPALPTPIREDVSLNAASAEKIMQWELDAGVNGFYINGATGEGPLLPEKTRVELAETAVAVVKPRGGAVINHVGAADYTEALRLARHAGQIGCDAVSSVAPNYFFHFTESQILDYYGRIADAAGLPVIVYVNGLMNLGVYEFMEKAMRIDGIAGLKFTMADYFTLHRLTELNGGDINVINGPDETLLCGLLMGADAGIGATYNVMPERFVGLWNAYHAGDIETARQLQFSINRVIEILRRYTTVPAVKQFFALRGIETGGAVFPGRVHTAEEAEALRRELAAEGLSV